MLLCIIMIILGILVADKSNQSRSVANLGGRQFMLVFYLLACCQTVSRLRLNSFNIFHQIQWLGLMWHLGKRGSSAHKVYSLKCSGDSARLGVKPAQLQIVFVCVGARSGTETAFQRIPLSPVYKKVWGVYLSASLVELTETMPVLAN